MNSTNMKNLRQKIKFIAFLIFFDAIFVFTVFPGEHRIISLAPSISDILFALDAEDRVIGVTDFCHYPAKIDELVNKGKIKRIGGFSTPNLELIISLKPTFIIGTKSLTWQIKNRIEKLGIKVIWLVEPDNIENLLQTILMVGDQIENRIKAEKIVNRIKEKLLKIKKKISIIPEKNKKTVFIEIWNNPLTTAGKNTFLSDLIKKAGAVPAIELMQDWPVISEEVLIKINPDVIFCAHTKPAYPQRLKFTKAIKNNHFFIPENKDIFLQPGTRIADAVSELFAYLYPEIKYDN